ncbi:MULTISPECIES: DUF3983 domain-containing protein [Bacillus]|nr:MULTISPECIES: DUF3983 domain-containing protein [Bacillus cereus group]
MFIFHKPTIRGKLIEKDRVKTARRNIFVQAGILK